MSVARPRRIGSGRSGSEWASPEVADAILELLERYVEDGEVTTSSRGIADELGVSQATAHRGLARLLESVPPRLVVVRRGSSRDYGTRYRLVSHDAADVPVA